MNTQESEIDNSEDNVTDNQESNRIRKFYRNMRENITENRMDFIDPNSNAIEMALESVEEYFKRVKKPREGVSDSNILLELALLGRERIKNVHCAFRAFNNNEFMEKLKTYMSNMDKNRKSQNSYIPKIENIDEEDEDDEPSRRTLTQRKSQPGKGSYLLTKSILESFGKRVMKNFNILPRPTFLLGSLKKEVLFTNRRQRQRKAPDTNIEYLRTNIRELDANSNENDENSTVKEIERIHEILKRKHERAVKKDLKLCYYTFVLNPDSFSRTIENIFYVSFLVKDRYAKIYLDGDNLPVIEPMTDESYSVADVCKKKRSATNIQSMISMTKAEWKELLEVFQIKTAIIKCN